jgi:hypothetical protein
VAKQLHWPELWASFSEGKLFSKISRSNPDEEKGRTLQAEGPTEVVQTGIEHLRTSTVGAKRD